ncbi:UDP-glucosyltransferase 2-like [Zerene cesonia]|uniref:UDP-glucosyltransferase 2-like n=1 Tax=Zerene cesonia TaxID=33412 RepID=UPI0018E4F75A|nr:UDP-glucosyltransferase 2-like [Zerene cesonia]
MLFLFIFAFVGVSDGYNLLLFFPIPGKSHSILAEAYVRHLTDAGHNVTYITPLPIKNPPPLLRQIDVSLNTDLLPGSIFDVQKFMSKELDLQETQLLFPIMQELMRATLQSDQMQKFMHDPKEQYDAVIVEWLFTELGAGLSSVFNCPLIWSTSTEPHSDILSLIDEPLNIAYTVYIWGREYSLDLYSRLQHLWTIIKIKYYQWKGHDIDNEIFVNSYKSAVQSRGLKLPSYEEVKYNASLMLGNSHISCGDAHRLPQAYKAIGGYHIKDNIDPLPHDLQKVMDESQEGVIYFSLGTMLKSSRMPNETRNKIIEFFGTLKQTVIWKYEKPIANSPRNIHFIQWAPQPSILAHPNTILFMTHGGILSLFETLKFGVPLIGFPMFGDQFSNINRAVKKGFGKRFILGQEPLEKLFKTVLDMIEDSKYRERAKEFSLIFHDRPVSPGAELVHWVEHVVRTRGAPLLRSPALMVPWYQKCYLDLIYVILVLILIIAYVIRKVCTKLFTKKSMLKNKTE